MQGHHLKHDDAGNLVFFFPGYTNEIPLPNLELSLYKSSELTFTLVEQEEARRSSISRRATRSRTRNEADNSQQALPTPIPLVPQAYHVKWFLAMQTPRFTPGYQPGRFTPYNHPRLVDRDGTRLTIHHGYMLTPLTSRDYHHLSSHYSLLWIIAS